MCSLSYSIDIRQAWIAKELRQEHAIARDICLQETCTCTGFVGLDPICSRVYDFQPHTRLYIYRTKSTQLNLHELHPLRLVPRPHHQPNVLALQLPHSW
jgi:hypothetical protein